MKEQVYISNIEIDHIDQINRRLANGWVITYKGLTITIMEKEF